MISFNLLETVKADIIYLDPPYTGTMNNYFGFYGLVDDFHNIRSNKTICKQLCTDKNSAIDLFDKLFSKLNNFKYWYLSYNNSSFPSKEELTVQLLGKYSNKVEVIERKHNYQITGKNKKEQNKEFLFIVKNENYNQTITRITLCHSRAMREYWSLTLCFH